MSDRRNEKGESPGRQRPRVRFALLLIGTALTSFGLFEIYTLIRRVFVFAKFVRHKQTSVGIFVDLRTIIHFAIFAALFVAGVSLIVVALRQKRRTR